MEQTIYGQTSKGLWLGAVLALTEGFLDVYTYPVWGGVFVSAQTGDIVLLGVQLMEGDWGGAGHYLVPILALAAGVLTVGLIHGRLRGVQVLHWRQITVAAELPLLTVVVFLPVALDNAINVLVTFVCAVQVESLRKVNGNAFATTMRTRNLCGGMERLCLRGRTGERDHEHRATQYCGITVFFIVGAALGARCSGWRGQRVVLGVCVLLLAALLFMSQRKLLVRTGKGV